jgi:hypothetical protein
MQIAQLVTNVSISGIEGVMSVHKTEMNFKEKYTRNRSIVMVSCLSPEELPKDHLHRMSMPTVSCKNEDTFNQQMWNLYKKIHMAHMQECLDMVVSRGIIPKLNYKYSNKAGCACGCSPGFMVVDQWPTRILWSVQFRTLEQQLKYDAERIEREKAQAAKKIEQLEKQLSELKALA